MACDVCGKIADTRDLSEFLKCDRMHVICDDCAKIADKLINKYRDMAWVRAKKKLLARQKQRFENSTKGEKR